MLQHVQENLVQSVVLVRQRDDRTNRVPLADGSLADEVQRDDELNADVALQK